VWFYWGVEAANQNSSRLRAGFPAILAHPVPGFNGVGGTIKKWENK